MIQEARYTSPGGNETVFSWENTKRTTELKTGVFTFPGMDGARVQHQGAGARTFPLVCIFSGDDCMAQADAFETMLIESGIGELQHPVYGTVKVVPTEKIEREDNTVSKLGEATVTVTFTETITDSEAAQLNETAAETIDQQYEEFADAAASGFADTAAASFADTAEGNLQEIIDAESITTQIEMTAALEAETQILTESLEPIAALDKATYPDWLASSKELKENIQNLYKKVKDAAGKIESTYTKALNIARLTLRIIKLPASLAVDLAEKIKGYATLTANLINQFKNDPFGAEKIKAAFAVARLALTGGAAAIASGSALSIAEIAALTGAVPRQAGAVRGGAGTPGGGNAGGASRGIGGEGGSGSGGTALGGMGTAALDKSIGATSRKEAVEAANTVAEYFETVMVFQDSKIAQNVFVDASPKAHLALTSLVHSSIQLILNAAFSLPLQKTITLDRDRQVIELCAELYGTTDCLDEFIIANNFNLNEIELLPMGKKVSYYVQGA
jgi:hypothetical protein